MIKYPKMLTGVADAKNLGRQYDVPPEDILLIALNLCGVKTRETNEKRIRFRFKLKNRSEFFYLGLCVNTGESPFLLKENKIFLREENIGIVYEKERDTCDSTYFRRNRTALTLNSNSRSRCRGCKFCGTYSQKAEDINNLLTEAKLIDYIKKLLSNKRKPDLSDIVDIGICTGCFPSEKDAVNHILMVKKVLKKFSFNGNLKYIGSQLKSKESLIKIEKFAKPFSLYFTTECFERRNELLHLYKAMISIRQMENILKMSKRMGFDTTILYISGLDSLKTVFKRFKELLPSMTKFPIVNLFQNYLPQQESIRIAEARDIKYYLETRKQLEEIFLPTTIRPRLWENYRGLWYLKFGNETIDGYRI